MSHQLHKKQNIRYYEEDYDNKQAQDSPVGQEIIEAGGKQLYWQMRMDDLHDARRKSRVELAKMLKITTEAVEEIEYHADLYLSLIRTHIESVGGSFDITAKFQNLDILVERICDMGRLTIRE